MYVPTYRDTTGEEDGSKILRRYPGGTKETGTVYISESNRKYYSGLKTPDIVSLYINTIRVNNQHVD